MASATTTERYQRPDPDHYWDGYQERRAALAAELLKLSPETKAEHAERAAAIIDSARTVALALTFDDFEDRFIAVGVYRAIKAYADAQAAAPKRRAAA